MSEDEVKIWVPDSDLPRVVVVGAGFAGISFIQKLKNKPFQVILLDKNNYHQFQPLLYQVATSGLEPDSITFPVRKLFKGQRNFVFRVAEVERIDTNAKRIYTNVGSLGFDYLVLGTGSDTNFYGLEAVQRNSIGLKSITDSLNIRSLMLQNLEKAALSCNVDERAALTSIVIVGGGPAGVEMAGAMAEFSKFVLPADYPDLKGELMKVYLVEAGTKLLGAMSEKSSKDTLKTLKAMGVEVLLGTGVKSYDGDTVDLGEGREIKTQTLVWTAGVAGVFPKGLERAISASGRRLKVNEYNQVKGYAYIFAIGDVSGMITNDYPHGHPMVAPAAIQQGVLLAENLVRKEAGKRMIPFGYKDKGSLATIGRRRAVADFGKMHYKGFFAWVIWSTVHLLSIIGFRNKLIVGINWLISYLTHDKGNRLIIRRYTKK